MAYSFELLSLSVGIVVDWKNILWVVVGGSFLFHAQMVSWRPNVARENMSFHVSRLFVRSVKSSKCGVNLSPGGWTLELHLCFSSQSSSCCKAKANWLLKTSHLRMISSCPALSVCRPCIYSSVLSHVTISLDLQFGVGLHLVDV